MKFEGYFANMKRANETVDKLKSLGFSKVIVDINEHYNADRNVQTNMAGTESAVSNSGLVLESDSHGISRDKAPLTAASPMVSGFGRFEEIADINYKVIVDAEESQGDKIKGTIKEMGGDLESPNFRKPRIEQDKDFNIYSTMNETRDFIDRENKRV